LGTTFSELAISAGAVKWPGVAVQTAVVRMPSQDAVVVELGCAENATRGISLVKSLQRGQGEGTGNSCKKERDE